MAHSGLAAFHGSPNFTDFTLVCGKRQWEVHRVVLAASSPVFSKMLLSEFKESVERRMIMDDDPEDCVDAMVKFMYTSEYEYDTTRTSSTGPRTFHVAMYLLADKYDIPKLKRQAIVAFRSCSAKPLDADLVEAMRLAYATPIATALLLSHAVGCIVNKSLVSSTTGDDEFEKEVSLTGLVKAVDGKEGLGTDIAAEAHRITTHLCKRLESMMSIIEDSGVEEYRCPHCRRVFMSDFAKGFPNQQMSCPNCGRAKLGATWLAEHLFLENMSFKSKLGWELLDANDP